ncbi:DEGP10 [Symbiodinium sp. CCMP2456]|nr:DEGP10 [Symbiodinium sp. CCMP2456]
MESRLQGLARQSWAAAVELWAADRGSETVWGASSASVLLAACGRAQAWRVALALLGKVQQCQLQPTLRSFNATMAAVARAEQLQQAQVLLSTLRRARAVPAASVQALLGVAVATSRWQWSLRLLRSARDAPALSAAAAACGRRRQWQRSLALFQEACARRLPWDAGLLQAVLSALAEAKQWERAMSLLRYQEAPDLAACNAALRACPDWQLSLLMLHDFRHSGLAPDEFSFASALSAASQRSAWEAALALRHEMVLDSVRADAVVGGALLLALRRGLRWQAALTLSPRGTLQVVEATEACFGAQQPAAFLFGELQRRQLALWRPRSLLGGRSAGIGEASVLHELLRSLHGGFAQAFARRVAVAMPVELGVFPPLSAKDEAELQDHGEGVKPPRRVAAGGAVPRARTLMVWLSFRLSLQRRAGADILLCNESADEWIAARAEQNCEWIPPFVAASPTEGLPLQTPDVCHFLRADLNAVPALPQRTEEVRPGRGCGHSPVHSRGRCDNFMVTMPRQDPQRMTSPETSPIRHNLNDSAFHLLLLANTAMAESCESGGSEGGEDVVARASKRPRTGGRARQSRGVSAGTGSVCKLFVKRVPCNFADPWRKHSQSASTGTGFLLDGRFVITNAHVVHRAVSVLVRATVGPPVKWNARVLAVGLPCDLAILAVEDEFWKGKESLTLSRDIPKLDDNVTCIGFPVGGENISVTRGVVSRIDVHHDGLLRVQIDAAINPGNSGGPVLGSHGKIVGVAASHLKHAHGSGLSSFFAFFGAIKSAGLTRGWFCSGCSCSCQPTFALVCKIRQ